jgi:serine/threonine protein kinase
MNRAPEMIKNSGYDPTISDIWACGVILFIMLAGFPPFQKPNVTDWWFQKLATNKHHLFWQVELI